MDTELQGSEAAARRLLDKIRVFVSERLNDEESALFAALLAPGVSLAYPDAEVSGFSADWRPDALPEALAQVLRGGGVRVEGLSD